MESAWRRFELRSKWIQSWRLIDVRARSRYQYVQSENWNLEIGNKLLDGSSLFLAWLKKLISEWTFFHWWTFSLSHLIRPFSLCLYQIHKKFHTSHFAGFFVWSIWYLHTPINQTWRLSKILHRRIFRPKILHSQFGIMKHRNLEKPWKPTWKHEKPTWNFERP